MIRLIPGVTIQYQHTITNTGTATDDYTITSHSSQGWPIVLSTNQVTNLAAGATADISVRVTVPITAVANSTDTTTITVTSDTDGSVSDAATDTTTVNAGETLVFLPLVVNGSTTVIDPTPTPTPTSTPIPCSPTGIDLVVTEIRIEPAVPVAGQAATIFVTLRNQGTTNVAYGNNFFLDVYVDRIPTPFAIGSPSWGVQGADLAAGASKTFSAPITLSGGIHAIYAQADTDNTVNECPNENNNIFGPLSVSVSGTVNQSVPTQQPMIIGTRGTPHSYKPNDSNTDTNINSNTDTGR